MDNFNLDIRDVYEFEKSQLIDNTNYNKALATKLSVDIEDMLTALPKIRTSQSPNRPRRLMILSGIDGHLIERDKTYYTMWQPSNLRQAAL
jgi:hypothetical protein